MVTHVNCNLIEIFKSYSENKNLKKKILFLHKLLIVILEIELPENFSYKRDRQELLIFIYFFLIIL